MMPGQVVQQKLQYDAYTNPNILSGAISQTTLDQHGQFLKAYAYLTNQKINGKAPMNGYESGRLATMDQKLRPVYSQYTDNSQLQYTITNYYSPAAQSQLYGYQPSFLKGIANSDQYIVNVPGVSSSQFTFYNLPS